MNSVDRMETRILNKCWANGNFKPGAARVREKTCFGENLDYSLNIKRPERRIYRRGKKARRSRKRNRL